MDSFGLIRSKIYPTWSDLIRGNYPNESEPIRNQGFIPNQPELGLIQTEFSIRINPNKSKVGMIQIGRYWKFALELSVIGLIRIDLYWKLGFGFVRTHSDWCLGINRIKSDWFYIVFHQTRYKTFFGLVRNDSKWLALARMQISEWIGIVLIDLEWISIRYFRQGRYEFRGIKNFIKLNVT